MLQAGLDAAPRFDGDSWVPLFSAAADGKSLFDANCDSRRMEVAWVGCRPEGEGWFVRFNGVASRSSTSASRLGHAPPAPGNQGQATDGEEAFRRVCAEWDITLPSREIRVGERELLLIGARGKPVKSGLRGYVFFQCPALTAGEDPASDDLARAIDQGDAEGIRDALRRGASLTVLPDGSSSPLLSALYKSGRFGPRRWQQCLEILLAAGCPINGISTDTPPLVDCVRPYLPDGPAREMVQFLLAHGADANATGPRGELALFEAVVHGRVALVRLLMQHGADPNAHDPDGRFDYRMAPPAGRGSLLLVRDGALYQDPQTARGKLRGHPKSTSNLTRGLAQTAQPGQMPTWKLFLDAPQAGPSRNSSVRRGDGL